MKFILIKISLLFCALLSSLSYASNSYVDVRNPNFHGEVMEVSAPNIIKVKTETADGDKHFWIELIHVDFGAKAGIECNLNWFEKLFEPSSVESNEKSCDLLDDMLDGNKVSVEITEWSQPILKGYVFLKQDGQHININHYLISNGIFPVDYKQSKDAGLVRLEKKARCNRLGIWEAKKGDPVEDLKCQGFAK